MKTILIVTLLCAANLTAGPGPASGAEGAQNPAPAHYWGKIVPANAGPKGVSRGGQEQNQKRWIHMYDRVEVTIQEYTTAQEQRQLTEIYLHAGKDALEKALYKTKKGFFRIGQGPLMPVLYATTTPQGAGRILGLIGETPTSSTNFPADVFNLPPRVPHVYTFIQLVVDEHGNGTGLLVLYAGVEFDKQARPLIKPALKQSYQLGEVHTE